ncbi:transporter substrate-binding domain-containing protein [Bosea vestrisii]|uniref:Transporter substrate-binding domain-containing protein n=1 Tax=Bosea vestrisii TaxID=151416 RepID=A0ABW0HDY8_9HYPH
MRRAFRSAFFAVLALSAGLIASLEARADKLDDILSKGVVRITVFADVPPFGMMNAKRELEGFDVDMARLVAKSLGVKLELVPVPAASRIPFLLTDKSDMNIAAMSITAERARQVMFSAPYADTSLAVYGAKALAVKSGADLGKSRIAVAKGTTEDLVLSALAPSADIMRTEDNATAVQAYLAGHAQLLAANSVVVVELAKQNPAKEFDFKFALRRAPAHITIRRGEHDLLRWLDTLIFQSTLNGDLDELHKKWLGGPMQPLPAL